VQPRVVGSGGHSAGHARRLASRFYSQPQPQWNCLHKGASERCFYLPVKIATDKVNKMSIGASNRRQNILVFHLPLIGPSSIAIPIIFPLDNQVSKSLP
jgi:hypothetical protein